MQELALLGSERWAGGYSKGTGTGTGRMVGAGARGSIGQINSEKGGWVVDG